jgi:hypothetical protein
MELSFLKKHFYDKVDEEIMSQVEVKYFTPREAFRTLPLVKKIVRDILNNAFEIKGISESRGGDIEDNQEVMELASEIDSFMLELEDIGCNYKDWNFQIGLVDFPSIIDGEDVYLCWRSDEDSIKYFHGIEEGFASRRLIPDEYL